jgi:predicted phosphodiesterase
LKHAILADIHSNLSALEAVLADIKTRGGTDDIWCLGDIVGYGPDPHRCIEVLTAYHLICIAGNHDRAAIGKLNTSDFNPEAAEAVRWTSLQLKSEDILFLGELPLVIENGEFTLAHGSPREPVWEYVLSSDDAEQNLGYFKTPYCFIGHSHIPMVFEFNSPRSGTKLTFDSDNFGGEIKLADARLILNPGSVGQPRDRDPRAGYAIYDSDARTVRLFRVEYDIAATQMRMRQAGLPSRLISRLSSGT